MAFRTSFGPTSNPGGTQRAETAITGARAVLLDSLFLASLTS
jgi:hypothetical protein